MRVGLQGAVEDLRRKLGEEEISYRSMLATSSAAGGLRMTVHGLVYDMTVKAAGRRPSAPGPTSTWPPPEFCRKRTWRISGTSTPT